MHRAVVAVYERTRGRPRALPVPPEGWGSLPLDPGTYLIEVGAEEVATVPEPVVADGVTTSAVAASAVSAALSLAERQAQGWEALVGRYSAALEQADGLLRAYSDRLQAAAPGGAPSSPVGTAVAAAAQALAPQLPGVLRALLAASPEGPPSGGGE